MCSYPKLDICYLRSSIFVCAGSFLDSGWFKKSYQSFTYSGCKKA